MLFSQVSWRPYWGLYLNAERNTHAYRGFSLEVLTQDQQISACRFNIAGTRLCLALGRINDVEMMFRPCGIHFEHVDRSAVKTLMLTWPEPPHSDYLTYRRSAPYQGEAIDYY